MRLFLALLCLFQLDATPFDCGEIDKTVEEAMEAFHIPGASIGLIVDGEIVHLKGYGRRNVQIEAPVGSNTCFAIGSCTKAFTAYLLAELVEEGAVSWDDPVNRFLPEFAFSNCASSSSITLRDLISHRTGMERHDTSWVAKTKYSSDPVKFFNFIEPRYPLRERFEYNNYMYKIASLVIEKITGNSWEKEVEERIFKRLELKDSSCSINSPSHADIASPHAEILGSIMLLKPFDPAPIAPGGGIVASINDLAAWTRLHLMTEKEHLKALQKIQIPFALNALEEIQPLGYGLGWFIGNYRGHHWVYHDGSVHGFHSTISMLPHKKIAVIILTNIGNNGNLFTKALAYTLLDNLLGHEKNNHLSKANEQRLKMQEAIEEGFRAFSALGEIKREDDLLNEIQGTYTHPAYGELKIFLESGRLNGQLGTMNFPIHFKDKNNLVCLSEILAIYGVPPIALIQINRNSEGAVKDLDFNLEYFRGTLPLKFQKQNSFSSIHR